MTVTGFGGELWCDPPAGLPGEFAVRRVPAYVPPVAGTGARFLFAARLGVGQLVAPSVRAGGVGEWHLHLIIGCSVFSVASLDWVDLNRSATALLLCWQGFLRVFVRLCEEINMLIFLRGES